MGVCAAPAFRGVFSLLLTPFTSRGEIDWPLYDEYVDWQLSHRPDGLFAVCGSSEMKWLSLDERLELARRAARRAGCVPVVATANLSPDADAHPEEIRRMADAGVGGLVLVPPDGMGKHPALLEEYLGRMALAAHVAGRPVLLYEWPEVDDHLLSPETFARLVERFGVGGIKDTTCTLEGIRAKIAAAGEHASVFQANTPFLLDAVLAGAKGVMAITSTACPDAVISFWEAASARAPEAEGRHRRLVFLDSVLRFSYPATAKHLLSLRGVPFLPYCRWPVRSRPEDVRALEAVFAALLQTQKEGGLQVG